MVFMKLWMEMKGSSAEGVLLTSVTFIAEKCFITHKDEGCF